MAIRCTDADLELASVADRLSCILDQVKQNLLYVDVGNRGGRHTRHQFQLYIVVLQPIRQHCNDAGYLAIHIGWLGLRWCKCEYQGQVACKQVAIVCRKQ